MLTAKQLKRYYAERFSGGKRTLARVLDYIALRSILLLAAIAFFRVQGFAAGIAVLLGTIVLAIGMLLMRLVHAVRYDAFVRRENKRIRQEILLRQMMLLPHEVFLEKIRPLAEESRVFGLQCAMPADANDLLQILRFAGSTAAIAVFSTAGYTKQAQEFASLAPVKLHLYGAKELESCASLLSQISIADVHDYIGTALQKRKEQKKRLQAQPFLPGSAAKYFFIAALLTGASFLARYALYYRMLAGLCSTIAVLSLLLNRGHATT